MKTLILILSFVLGTPALAQSACQTKISKAITTSAKVVGVTQDFGFELGDPTDAGKDIYGNPLQSYSTSLFFIDEGYITGSNASVVVRKASCEIIKLRLSLGD